MLVLVRHGRTRANASGVLLGRADPPLDDAGEAQARAVARALAPLEAPHVVCSPLQRAVQTAVALGHPFTTDERWIELDYGELDGLPQTDVPAAVWTAWQADSAWTPSGGESLDGVARRVAEACDELSAAARDGDVIVVSHVSPIKAAIAWALGVSADVSWRMHLDVASISRVEVTQRRTTLRSYNERFHLTDDR